MKREEKNAATRRRILDAAADEFSRRGYDGASLNTVCARNDLSKGIIYHYFRDKDELYLTCAQECFDALTAYIENGTKEDAGSVEAKLRHYFDVRTRFFAENTVCLGLFAEVVMNPPEALSDKLAKIREPFDAMNIARLTGLLSGAALREGLTADAVIGDFRIYMDFFNLRFRTALAGGRDPERVMREHEKRCYRQIGILLYGVIGDKA